MNERKSRFLRKGVKYFMYKNMNVKPLALLICGVVDVCNKAIIS